MPTSVSYRYGGFGSSRTTFPTYAEPVQTAGAGGPFPNGHLASFVAWTFPAPVIPVPSLDSSFLDLSKPPYNADFTGAADAGPAFRQAIADAQAQGRNVDISHGGNGGILMIRTAPLESMHNYNGALIAGPGLVSGDGTPIRIVGAGRHKTQLVLATSNDWSLGGATVTVTGTLGAAGTLTDTTKNWDVNQWVGFELMGPGGTHQTDIPYGVISANTATQLSITSWLQTPAAGMQYNIVSDSQVNFTKMFQIETSGVSLEHFAVDSRSYGGNPGLVNDFSGIHTIADRTSLLGLGILGGSDYILRHLQKSDNSTPKGHIVNDLYLAGYGGGVVADWDMAGPCENFRFQNIHHFGGRVAPFGITNGEIDGYDYTPDPRANTTHALDIGGANIFGLDIRNVIARNGKAFYLQPGGAGANINSVHITRALQTVRDTTVTLENVIGTCNDFQLMESTLGRLSIQLNTGSPGLYGAVDAQTTYTEITEDGISGATVHLAGTIFA